MANAQEFVLDLYGCSTEKFDRESIREYLKVLCELLDAETENVFTWDYEYKDRVLSIQWTDFDIITVHSYIETGSIMINVFSCKSFNHGKVRHLSREFFGTEKSSEDCLVRGEV